MKNGNGSISLSEYYGVIDTNLFAFLKNLFFFFETFFFLNFYRYVKVEYSHKNMSKFP